MKYSITLLCLALFVSGLETTESNVKPRRTQHTEGRIENNTPLDIVNTVVSGCDPYDWDGGNSPDISSKFASQYIPAHSSLQRRFEVNYYASNSPYGITLYFEDGTSVYYKINQKAAIDKADANLRWSSIIYDVSYYREGSYTLVVKVEFSSWTSKIRSLLSSAKSYLQQNKYEDAENEIDNEAVLTSLVNSDLVSRALTSSLNDARFNVLKSYGTVLYENGLQNVYYDNIQASRNLTVARLKFQEALGIRSDQEIEGYTAVIDGLLNK